MNREELMQILPHRGNMLLIDEARLEGVRAHGKYTVRGSEWFLDGHFPGNPIVPGVILCEILAQSACVLLDSEVKGKAGVTTFLTGINSARFKNPVKPGDTLETECVILKAKPPFYFAEGRASVGGKLCVKAEFSFSLIAREEI